MTTKTSKTPMPPKTLKALKLSIEHWTRLAEGQRKYGEDHTATSCALCDLFMLHVSTNLCHGCPVRQRTNIQACLGSPWHEADKAYRSNGLGYRSEAFKSAALLELNFLKSLLPKTSKSTGK